MTATAEIAAPTLDEVYGTAVKKAKKEYDHALSLLLAERAVPGRIHWALYKLPHQETSITRHQAKGVALAIERDLPDIEARCQRAVEARTRRMEILPGIRELRDQAPEEIRRDITYLMEVEPMLNSYHGFLNRYEKTLSRAEAWLLHRTQKVSELRAAPVRTRKRQRVPSKCAKCGCDPVHTSNAQHDRSM